MCFMDSSDDEPDVWLTVRNGRAVPAPPVIYVPGLRRIQEQLQSRARHTEMGPADATGSFRVPAAIIPSRTTPCSHSLANGPNFRSTIYVAKRRPRSPLKDLARRSALIAGAYLEKPECASEQPPSCSALDPHQKRVLDDSNEHSARPAPEPEEPESKIDSISPSELSAPSSPARSILKRSVSPFVEGANVSSDTKGDQSAGAACGPNATQPESRKQRKSVSFADTMEDISVPTSTPAEWGASIAKRLVNETSKTKVRDPTSPARRDIGGVTGARSGCSVCREKHDHQMSPRTKGSSRVRQARKSSHFHGEDFRLRLSPLCAGMTGKAPTELHDIADTRSGIDDEDADSGVDDEIKVLWSSKSSSRE